jgi:hypothetical protein
MRIPRTGGTLRLSDKACISKLLGRAGGLGITTHRLSSGDPMHKKQGTHAQIFVRWPTHPYPPDTTAGCRTTLKKPKACLAKWLLRIRARIAGVASSGWRSCVLPGGYGFDQDDRVEVKPAASRGQSGVRTHSRPLKPIIRAI